MRGELRSKPTLIHLDNISHDGRGIGRVSGKVVFVPGALPGETVQAALVRRHRRFDEYRLVQVVEASIERVVPLCPLVGRCGGCDLQHVAIVAQRQHKQQAVLELLARQAGLTPDRLEAPVASEPFGYRRRARLAVRVPRRGRPVLGFREAGGNQVVEVPECPVLAEEIAALPGELQQAIARLERPRILAHLELGVAEAPDGCRHPLIHVRATHLPGDADLEVLGALAASRGAYLSLQAGDAPTRLLHRPVEAPPGYRLPQFDLHIVIEPGDFVQGNAAVNRAMVARAATWLGEGNTARLLDAFAGVGNFSLPLARRGWRVLGLEGNAAMVDRARENARRNGVDHVEFQQHDLHDQPLDAKVFDAAVLDPPRAGAHPLTACLADARVPRILYVSCSPSTLARDAAVLAAAGYGLSRMSLVDMFPQTSHVEVMALFQNLPVSAKGS